jgi:hypothetical protein
MACNRDIFTLPLDELCNPKPESPSYVFSQFAVVHLICKQVYPENTETHFSAPT